MSKQEFFHIFTILIFSMEIKIDLEEYSIRTGMKYYWEEGFIIHTGINNMEILISANKAGLRSLAIQLLALAQDDVAVGTHIHYDESTSLEGGASNMVIEKI